MSWHWHQLALCAVVLGVTLAGCEPAPQRGLVVEGERSVDTAQLAIVGRYPLPASTMDTIPLRITALAIGTDQHINAVADDGVLYRAESRGAMRPRFRLMREADLPQRVVRALIARADGSVLVRDARGDIHEFTRTGARAATWRVGDAHSLWGQQLLAQAAQGVTAGVDRSRATAADETVALATLLEPEGSQADTLRVAREHQKGCSAESGAHFRSGSFDDIRTRYTSSLQWAPLRSGGFVAGCNADYEFVIVRADGHVVRVLQERAPIRVSPDEQRSFVAAWTLRMRNGGGGADWQWQGEELPAHKPAYQRMLTTSDDRIWIWPAQPSRTVPAPSQWIFVGGPKTLYVESTTGAFDVFSPDGQYLGAVAIPAELGFAPFGVAPPPVIHGDTAWFAATDSSGVNAVVRARILWPRSSLRAAVTEVSRPHGRMNSSRPDD